MRPKPSVCQAQAEFPNGLYQPEGSFRFSVDALLLASFMRGEAGHFVADFGAGCGVVGLAYLLQNTQSRVVGFENQSELVAAAYRNATALGCDERYACVKVDLTRPMDKSDFFTRGVRKSTSVNKQLMLENMPADAKGESRSGAGGSAGEGAGTADKTIDEPVVQAISEPIAQACAMAVARGGFDIVLTNPPYRLLGSGRLPKRLMRRQALFAPTGTVEKFCAAAHVLLASHGRLGLVFPAEREDWIRAIICEGGFELERVLRVHGRAGKKATLILLEARKKGDENPPKGKIREEVPLVLYDQANRLTKEAVLFCPYLG